jgi:parvulin-like peptidyl-prolyl isomerase
MRVFTIANSLALVLAMAANAQTPTAVKPPVAAPKPAIVAPPAPDIPPTTVVITVGDEKITRAQFEALLAALPEQVRKQAEGPNKRKFVDQFVELKSLAYEARRRHIDQDPEVKQRMTLQQDSFLASELYQTFKPEDAALKSYYDEHKSDYDQVKASHILIRFKGSTVAVRKDMKDLTEEEALAKAKEVRAKLTAGADFAATAKAESDDAGSGQTGGSLPPFAHGQMVPAFEQAAYALPVGQVSEPVKTQFGYHLIKVDERITKQFSDVKPQIDAKLKADIAKKSVDDIKKAVPVVIDEQYFGK